MDIILDILLRKMSEVILSYFGKRGNDETRLCVSQFSNHCRVWPLFECFLFKHRFQSFHYVGSRVSARVSVFNFVFCSVVSRLVRFSLPLARWPCSHPFIT